MELVLCVSDCKEYTVGILRVLSSPCAPRFKYYDKMGKAFDTDMGFIEILKCVSPWTTAGREHFC